MSDDRSKDVEWRVRGARDVVPDSMKAFREMETAFRGVCEQSGYEEVRTPVIEYLHLFTVPGALTPAMLGGLYSFLDWDGWSGERVVLRPDSTIPACRLHVENFGKRGLSRFYYVQNVFRYDSPSHEDRELWQFGAELLGKVQPKVGGDLEILLLARKAVSTVTGCRPVVRISHAGVLRRCLECLDLPSDVRARAYDLLQEGKLEQLAGLREKYGGVGELLRLLDLTGNSPAFLANVKSLFRGDLPFQRSVQELLEISRMLEEMEVSFEVDFRLARNLEYYTGLMFDLCVGDDRVGGGGRYDDLAKAMGDGRLPACGFGLGADRLRAVRKEPARRDQGTSVLVRIATDDLDLTKQALSLADALRDHGLRVEALRTHRAGSPDAPRWTVTLEKKRKQPVAILQKRGSRGRETYVLGDIKKLVKVLKGS